MDGLPEVIYGVPVAVLVPAMVELVKGAGLPSEWAGLAAVACAALLLALAELAGIADLSVWGVVLGGLIYGMAAAGLYSVGKKAAEAVQGDE